jgi:hypothetical protein
MKRESAEQIIRAGELCGAECEFRPDYSGRGMMGKTTAAVIFGCINDFVEAVAYAAISSDDHDALIEDVRKFRTDNIGSDVVFY